jgi:hypothetical protein
MTLQWATRLLAAVPCLLIAAHSALGDGTVERATGCGDRIFVSSVNGYSVLTAIGADGLSDRDQLVGEVDKIGRTMLYDKTAGRNFSANVEERRLDRAAVAQRMAILCRSRLGNALTTALVMRSEGCGNRIVVSGDQGYAVLERLAGGVVGKDDIVTGDFNKPGRATIHDRQTGSTLIVFVEDYGLSRAAADRKMRALCRSGR